LPRGSSSAPRVRGAETGARRFSMDAHERATSVWYRMAGLISRKQKDLAVSRIADELRAAQYEVWLEAARLVLSGEPIEIARQMHERAERTIRRPTSKS
jgi:hypothetical protein